MTIRDKVMDKFWLDFLADKDCEVYLSNARYHAETAFWVWFRESPQIKLVGKLVDYL